MGEESVSKIDKLLTSSGEVPTADLRLQSQKVNHASMWSGVFLLSVCVGFQIMQNNAGVFRTAELLEEGCEKIDSVYKEFDSVKVLSSFHSPLPICWLNPPPRPSYGAL